MSAWNPADAMLWAFVGPAIVALAVALLGKWPNIRETATLIGSTSIFGLVAGVLLPAVQRGERPRLDLVEILPGLKLTFELEPLGMVFALVASGLWIVTSIYAVGYMRGHHEKNQTRFFVCFALAIFGALGVAFSGNMLTLFVFYEAITLSTFPLVTHHGTEAAKRSGRIYLGILMGTSIAFLLMALVWTQVLAGTTDFKVGGILDGKITQELLPWLLALYALGTAKAALMPFHRWLPAAMVAPTPVSALLHAVAVVKAGVFTVTKVVIYIFGADLLLTTGASTWLQALAAFTLTAAAIVALTQNNLKRRLAYSTISQLAYIVLGASLVTQTALVGAGLHIVTHAMGKITLFFCAGAIYVGAHKTDISKMHGLGRKMPWTFAAFLVGSLSIIGIPPLGGAWSKWFLASGAVDGERLPILALYMVSSLLAIGYLMPVVAKAFFFTPPEYDENPYNNEDHVDAHEPLLCVLPPVLTAAGCVALFFYMQPIADLLNSIWTQGGTP